MANSETVKLKSYIDVQKEADAGEAITPGALVEYDSNGDFQNHASAGENVLPIFAIEDALQGKEINEQYDSGDPVRGWIPTRGDEVNAILADGENVKKGDWLESAGNGYLQKHTADSAGAVEYPNAIVGMALEDLDLSGSGDAESSAELGYPYNRIAVLIY